MYTKGDYIHHVTNGLCRVEDVTTIEIDGVDKDRLYYRLWPVGWVKIIKTLYLRMQDRQARGQKITAMDEQYLRKTEDRLYEELSFALGKKKEDMESYIIEQIEGKEKRCTSED